MLAILCSGQGNQRADMFALLRRDPVAAALLDRAVAERWLEEVVAAWLMATSPEPENLHVDRFTQPLLCLYQQAVWAAVAGRIGRVDLFAGLSLGELSAAACAGAMDAPTVLRLASRRAKAMDDASPSGGLIAVLGLDQDAIASLCQETNAAVAIRTGPTHWTLGCLARSRDAVVHGAQARGASRVVPLAVGVPSHTHWLKSAAGPFRAELEATPLERMRAPLLAGVSGQRIWSPGQLIDGLCNQLHTTVRWDLCIDSLLSSGIRVALELGPGYTLAHTLLDRDPTIAARSIHEFSTLADAAAWAIRMNSTRGG
jgi:[acyl-carrier-protein] S-malonyltransferase